MTVKVKVQEQERELELELALALVEEKGLHCSRQRPNSRLRIEPDHSSSVFCGSRPPDRVYAYACEGVWLVAQVRSLRTKPLGPVL